MFKKDSYRWQIGTSKTTKIQCFDRFPRIISPLKCSRILLTFFAKHINTHNLTQTMYNMKNLHNYVTKLLIYGVVGDRLLTSPCLLHYFCHSVQWGRRFTYWHMYLYQSLFVPVYAYAFMTSRQKMEWGEWVRGGLASHSTHYRSFQRCFYGSWGPQEAPLQVCVNNNLSCQLTVAETA